MGQPVPAAVGRDISPRQDLSLRLALRIDRRTLAKIEALAGKEGVSKSEAARAVLAQALEDDAKLDRAKGAIRQRAALRARLLTKLSSAVEDVLSEEL